MKDLFETITQERNEKRGRRQRTARTVREASLAGEALYDALGGSYKDDSWSSLSDRSFFDLDHAMASGSRRESPVMTETEEDSEDWDE